MRKLFEITHKGEESHKLYVAAEDMKRVTELYDPAKIELISEKIMIVRDRGPDPYDGEDMTMFKEIISFLQHQTLFDKIKKGETPLQYIERMTQHIVNVECINRGHQNALKEKDDEIKKLKWILKSAVESEEKHYDSEDTKAGWIDEAKEVLI